MNKIYLPSILFLAIALFSCSKNNSNSSSSTNTPSIQGKWFQSKMVEKSSFNPNPGFGSPYTNFDTTYFNTHDYIQFQSNGTWNAGCDTCTTNQSGDYYLQNNNLYIIYHDTQSTNDTTLFDILQLDANTLNLHNSDSFSDSSGTKSYEEWIYSYK